MHRWTCNFVLLVSAALMTCGCTPVSQEPAVFQVSAIRALQQGAYEGVISCGELKKHGDLGIGTFAGLDGEMVVLDGQVYRVPAVGQPNRCPDSLLTPFACVTFFKPESTVSVHDRLDLPGLQKALDAELSTPNLFYAVRIDGEFECVQTRSIARQQPPYPTLLAATQHQNVFEFRKVRGTIVGFRCPPFVGGVNVPGWHLHFLTADRTGGGHLIGLAVQDPQVQLMTLRQLRMVLPQQGQFLTDDLSRDAARDLQKAEK